MTETKTEELILSEDIDIKDISSKTINSKEFRSNKFIEKVIQLIEEFGFDHYISKLLFNFLVLQFTLPNDYIIQITFFGSIAPVLYVIRYNYSLSECKKVATLLLTEESDIDIYLDSNVNTFLDQLETLKLNIIKPDEDKSLEGIYLKKNFKLTKVKLKISNDWYLKLNVIFGDIFLNYPILIYCMNLESEIILDIVSNTNSETLTLYHSPRFLILDINLDTTTNFFEGLVSRHTRKFKLKNITLSTMACNIKTHCKMKKYKNLKYLREYPIDYEVKLLNPSIYLQCKREWDINILLLLEQNSVILSDDYCEIGIEYKKIKENYEGYFNLMSKYWEFKHNMLADKYLFNKSRIKVLNENKEDSVDEEKISLYTSINRGIDFLYNNHVFLPEQSSHGLLKLEYKINKNKIMRNLKEKLSPITLEEYNDDDKLVLYSCGHLGLVNKDMAKYLLILENKLRGFETGEFPPPICCSYCRGTGMEGYTPLFPDYQLKAINARSLHEQNLYKKTYRGIKVLLHESGFYFAGIESFDKVFINLKKEFKF